MNVDIRIGDQFTQMVDELRNHTHPVLAELGKLTWRLVGNRVVSVAVMPDIPVPSLSFMAMASGDSIVGTFVCPADWIKQIEANPTYCMGGIVFTSSQCRDFWNGKIKDPAIIRRAASYEAEFLLTVPDLIPNDYQKQVLKVFPRGLASASELQYKGKAFMDAR